MQENQIHVRPPERMPRVERLLGRIDQPEVDDLDTLPRELLLDDTEVSLEPFLEPDELRPVGVEADAKQSDFYGAHGR